MPSGLAVGRTLKTLDIVGANFETGGRIMAQCKNTHYLLEALPEGFNQAIATEGENFLFAFGGCNFTDNRVRVVTGEDIRLWMAEDKNGQRYRELIAPLKPEVAT